MKVDLYTVVGSAQGDNVTASKVTIIGEERPRTAVTVTQEYGEDDDIIMCVDIEADRGFIELVTKPKNGHVRIRVRPR